MISAEAELESALAGRRAVAGPHVATRLAERGDDIIPEADRLSLVHPRDLDGARSLDAPPLGLDDRGAVGMRDHLPPGVDGGDRRVKAGPGQGAGQVAGRPVGVGRRGDQLAGAPVPFQGRSTRLDDDLGGTPDRVNRQVRPSLGDQAAGQGRRQGDPGDPSRDAHRSLLLGGGKQDEESSDLGARTSPGSGAESGDGWARWGGGSRPALRGRKDNHGLYRPSGEGFKQNQTNRGCIS